VINLFPINASNVCIYQTRPSLTLGLLTRYLSLKPVTSIQIFARSSVSYMPLLIGSVTNIVLFGSNSERFAEGMTTIVRSLTTPP
jgi:hypothetical protein